MFTPIGPTSLSNGCRFDLSYTKQLHRELESSALSIKFVIEGEEVYNFNGKDHKVKTQQFLTINNKRCTAIIDSDIESKGFCMGIPYHLLDEIMASLSEQTPKANFIDYLHGDDFFERVTNAGNSRMGSYLQCLATTLQTSLMEHSKIYIEELFLRVAEHAIAEQLNAYKEFSTIAVSKIEIQKDIYRKLLEARDYMNAHLAQDVKMEDVASLAHISEYYFYRLFRSAFKKTPYQYLLERRLEQAKKLLKKGMPVSHIAIETGFKDIYSFSKAFKRQEQISPTHYLQKILLSKQ